MDASDKLQPEDNEIIDLVRDKKVLAALNKTDLGFVIEEKCLENLLGADNIIKMSVKNQTGIDELEERIKDLVYHEKLSISKNKMVTNISIKIFWTRRWRVSKGLYCQ